MTYSISSRDAGRLSQLVLFSAAIFLTASPASAITPTYSTDFESEVTDSTPSAVTSVSGVVKVTEIVGKAGPKVLSLNGEVSSAQARYDISGASRGIYWWDAQVSPAAFSGAEVFVDFDGARIALKKTTQGLAKFQVFNAATAAWLPVGGEFFTDTDDNLADFVRLSVRMNYFTGRFHVFLNGELLAEDVSLAGSPVAVIPTKLNFFSAHRISPEPALSELLLDNLSVSATTPAGLSFDADGDGVSDADEVAMGSRPNNPDTDGDGVPDGFDAFPNDRDRWEAPPGSGSDYIAPVITLITPVGATPIP